MTYVVLGIGSILGVWRLADVWYALHVEMRYEAWEADLERDAEGVRLDFQPLQAGEGDVGLLLVPGFAGAPSLYRFFIPEFVERGFACRAIRLPGFGETFDQAAAVRRSDWIRAVTVAAQDMRADHEVVWIVAHSLGAAVALRAFQAESNLADGLVLLAPLLEVSDTRSPILDPDEWFVVGERLIRESRMVESAFPIDADDPHVREKEVRDRFIPLNIYAELFALLEDLHAEPVTLDLPVMLVLSQRDPIVDSEAAKEWFSRVRDGRHRLLVADPAGHLLPLDTGWEALVVDISDYVMEHREGAPAPPELNES